MIASKKTGAVLAAAAAALFAAGTIAVVSAPAEAASVKCTGANACKGQSACKSASNSCKGMKSCKGKGWVESKNAADCTKSGGKAG